MSDGWLLPLWLLSISVLPFTIWSLVTQAFIIRKWCLFCCTLVFLFWANATVLFFFNTQPIVISIPILALAALLFIVCLVIVIETSKHIGSKTRLYNQQREIAKIKYDIRIIQNQLSETKYAIENIGLTFGHSESSHTIGLYISASCPHCRAALKEFRRLTEIYPDFYYRLIFSVNSNSFDDKTNVIIFYLMNLYKAMNSDEFFDIMDAWYTKLNKDFEALKKTYPVLSMNDNWQEIDAMFLFSQQSKISSTPTLILNGRIFSQLYTYQDLPGIVRALNSEEK